MKPELYHENGFARFNGVINPAAVSEAEEWIVKNRVLKKIPQVKDFHNRNNPLPIKLRKLWFADPKFWSHFLTSSGVIELPRLLIGEKFLLIRSAAFIKYPRSNSTVGWHCDANLWGHQCESGLTVWIPLTSVSGNSGCLQFLPKSHMQPHGRLYWDKSHPYHKVMEISGPCLPLAVPAELGDCIVMDQRTVHCSGSNQSDKERIGLVLAFARCNHEALNEPAIVIDPECRFTKI